MRKISAIISTLVLAAASLGQCQNCQDGVCIMPALKPGCECTNCTCEKCNDCKDCKNCSGCIFKEYEWEDRGSGLYFLRKKGKIVGQFAGGEYYPWNGKDNLPATKPPIDPPGKFSVLTEEIKKWSCNGIVKGKCCERDKVTYRGREIHPNAIQAAFDGKLEDDSQKGYFVIIAKDPELRKSILDDWNALPTDFISRYNVWLAPPDHFSMQDRFAGKPRFFTEGDPTIVLQKANGDVLFRRPQAGQAYKHSDLQSLLKSDPSYKPSLDPGAPEAEPASNSFLSTQVVTSAALVGAGALLIFLRRKK